MRLKQVAIFLIFLLIIAYLILPTQKEPQTPGERPEKLFDECPANTKILLTSDHQIIKNNPALAIIKDRFSSIQLSVYRLQGTNKLEVPSDKIEYTVSHHVSKILDPEDIISVNSDGTATYLSEGYVTVIAHDTECNIDSEPLLIATGQAYGNPEMNDVIAVFPDDYPQGGLYTFGDMMTNYPNYMEFVNLAYRIESELYGGFKPQQGAKQIFALLDLPNHCGGNGNPLETAPCCYMNCDNGQPQYNVVIHEMGHNFADSATGMRQLLWANNGRINNAGFGECVASLPVIYLANEVVNSPEEYGISKDSFEWRYYKDFLSSDIPYAKAQLENFENRILSNEIDGVFDYDVDFDRVAVFCSFFQSYAYNLTERQNDYGNDIIRRFLSLFGDESLIEFEDSKVDTYFAAAVSAAAGNDLRSQFEFWGFEIDDNYFDEIYTILIGTLQ